MHRLTRITALLAIASLSGCAQVYHYGVRPTLKLALMPVAIVQSTVRGTVRAVKAPFDYLSREHADTTPLAQALTIHTNPSRTAFGRLYKQEGALIFGLKADGTLWQWPYVNPLAPVPPTNLYPQPEPVPGMDNVFKIDSDRGHVVALKKDGTVWGWGENKYGQLGTLASGNAWGQIPGLSDIVDIGACENATITLDRSGRIQALGAMAPVFAEADFQQAHPQPVLVHQDARMVKLTVGGTCGTFAIRSDGSFHLWEREQSWNITRVVKRPEEIRMPLPEPEGSVNLPNSFPGQMAIKRTRDGRLLILKPSVWIDPRDVTLEPRERYAVEVVLAPRAHPDYIKAHPPLLSLDQTLARPVVDIAIRGESYYFLLDDGSVMARGGNMRGELGQGYVESWFYDDKRARNRFLRVKNLGHIVRITPYGMALDDKGRIWHWGDVFDLDPLALNRFAPIPDVAVDGLDVVDIESGADMLIYTRDGTVYRWGEGSGAIGDAEIDARAYLSGEARLYKARWTWK